MTERKAGQCREAEPRLADLLEDPVLHAMLRKDRVSRDELMAMIAAARRRLGLVEEGAPPAPDARVTARRAGHVQAGSSSLSQ